MTNLNWSQEHLLGEAQLDREHQEMFALVQALCGASRAQAADLVGRLEELARGHFEAEEARMRETGYYGRAAHRAEHQALLEAFAKVRREDAAPDPARIALELGSVLIRHIREVDRVFARFLGDRNR